VGTKVRKLGWKKFTSFVSRENKRTDLVNKRVDIYI